MSATSAPRALTGRKAVELAGWLVLCLGVGFAGGVATIEGVREWYPSLRKPPWTPPSFLFGPVWTVLYCLMALAAWRVAIRRDQADVRRAIVLFLVQLTLNAAWSPLFFGAKQVGPALGLIVLMLAAIALTIALFRRVDRPAAWLMVPYLLWVSYATTLNAGIWWLNRAA